jgi:hypothetical protein
MVGLFAVTVVLALPLGVGAVQELYILGIQGGQVQPFWVGAAGVVVCAMIPLAAVVLWRRWRNARSLAIAAALLHIGFHVYASLPPHRNVGIGAALVACVYGVAFLIFAARRHEPAGHGMSAGAGAHP